MKRFQDWFNGLPVRQQKQVLILFCLLFGALLMLSLRYQQMRLNTGSILQPRIKTDTIKHR